MSCTIGNKKELLTKALGLDEDTLKSAVDTINGMSVTEKVNLGFTPDRILVRMLNGMELKLGDKPAKVLRLTVNGSIPESSVAMVHLEVGGKYEKRVLGSEVGDLGLSADDVIRYKSEADFVFKATEKSHQLASDAVVNPQMIYDLVQGIEKYDRGISTEEKTNLDKALRNIVTPLKDILPKMTVTLTEESAKTGGMIELMGNVGNVYLGASGKKGDMSVYEAFVHEMYHAVTSFALNTKDPEAAAIRKEIETVRDTFMSSKEAQKVFMENLPDKDNAKRDLNRLLDYFAGIDEGMFKAENAGRSIQDFTGRERGLHEFIAYAATNTAMIKALEVIATKNKEEVYPNLAAKVVGLVRKMFNWLVDTVQKRPKGDDAVQMAWLIDRLVKINHKQVVEKKRGIMSGMVGVLEKADKKAADRINDYREKAKKRPINVPTSKLGRYIQLPLNLMRATYDVEMRKAVAAGFSFSGMDLTTTMPTILRHGLETDQRSDSSQALGMINQFHDTQREMIRRQTRMRLASNFSREMTTEDFYGLNVVVASDYVSVMDKHDLVDLLDSKELDKKVAAVEKELKSLSDEKEYRYFEAQSEMLAEYMVNGTDNILLLKNAKNIAMRVNSADNAKKEADPKKVELIDELVSLYAFRKSGAEARNKLKEIVQEEMDKPEGEVNGVVEMLYTLRGMKESAKRNLFANEEGVSQEIKGYRVDVLDENTDIKVARIEDEAKLKREGYKLIYEVNNHSMDSSGRQAIYKSVLPMKNRIHKVAMRYKNTEARGSSFSQSHNRDGGSASNLKAQRDIKAARNDMYAKVRAIEEGTYKTGKDDNKITPRFNSEGNVIDFNYNMDLETKKILLDADVDVFNIIGSTAASNYDKEVSVKHNEKVIREIYEEAAVNAPKYKGDKILGKTDNRVYVWVGSNSLNEQRKELWSIFPDEGKEVFRVMAIENNSPEVGFYVREDLMNNLLGFREKSIVDMPVFRNMDTRTKYALQVAEEIVAAMIKIYKSQILLRVPEVLFMNILSNFNSMIFYKISPMKAFKYKMNAVKDLTDFIELAKQKVNLEMKIQSGKASRDEIRKLSVIENKMNMSSVKPMMDAGFYNQILEDIEGDETGNIVKDYVGKKLEFLPEVVKNAGRWMWLTDTNPVVKFMETSTQYSDFVARYALYNLLVKEKGKSKDEAIVTVRNLFVNYTNANSPMLEWANKMGAVMFTKYFTNAQRAIIELGKGNPVTFLGLMLGQQYVMDVPDVTDASPLNKDLVNLFYNPVEGMMRAAMPGSYVMYDSLMH